MENDHATFDGLHGHEYVDSKNRTVVRSVRILGDFWRHPSFGKKITTPTLRQENILITWQLWQYLDSSANARIVRKIRLEKQYSILANKKKINTYHISVIIIIAFFVFIQRKILHSAEKN